MSVPVPRPPTESLRPDPGVWATLARDFITQQSSSPSAIPGAATLATELGLPVGPLVWSGHQATFWHPGILAKRFAASAVAETLSGAHAVWLVVDQDAADASMLALPTLAASGARSSTRLLLRSVPSRTVAGPKSPSLARAALLAPDGATIASVSGAPAFVRSGLEALGRALDSASPASAPAANQAIHATRAVDALLAGIALPIHIVYASALASTALFTTLCERMLQDPERCARAYNQGVLEHPESGLRPLVCAGGRVELPLWKLGLARVGSPRESVFASELPALLSPHAPTPRLLPKALLMTAMVRLGASCLFIHGLGGEKYDPATERWLALWLGGGVRLAPAVAATADLYLALAGEAPATTLRARNAAVQQLRRQHYQPASDELAQRKGAMLEAIAALPRRSAARRAAYQELTRLIEAHRASHAAEIARADAARASLLGEARDPSIPDTDPTARRDWPFFLYPPHDLLALRERISVRLA